MRPWAISHRSASEIVFDGRPDTVNPWELIAAASRATVQGPRSKITVVHTYRNMRPDSTTSPGASEIDIGSIRQSCLHPVTLRPSAGRTRASIRVVPVAGAGTRPLALRGRDDLIDHFRTAAKRALANQPGKSLMPIGLRGVGKTVLLNRFAEIAEEEGLVVGFIEAPETGDFRRLLVSRLRRIVLGFENEQTSAKVLKASTAVVSQSPTCSTQGFCTPVTRSHGSARGWEPSIPQRSPTPARSCFPMVECSRRPHGPRWKRQISRRMTAGTHGGPRTMSGS